MNHIKRHRKIHTMKKSYHCDLFGKVIISRNHLKSDPSKISCYCALCDSGFKFSDHMKKHLKLHHVENSYQCALCFLSADDIFQAENFTKQTVIKCWLVLMVYQKLHDPLA